MSLIHLFLVGIAGFIGAIIRYIISEKMNRNVTGSFPYGTLLLNLVGAFLLGLLFSSRVGDVYILIIGTGLLGSITTFSTMNKELYTLQKFPKTWMLYFLLSYVGGFLFAYVGYKVL